MDTEEEVGAEDESDEQVEGPTAPGETAAETGGQGEEAERRLTGTAGEEEASDEVSAEDDEGPTSVQEADRRFTGGAADERQSSGQGASAANAPLSSGEQEERASVTGSGRRVTGGAEASDQPPDETPPSPEGQDEGPSSVQGADRRFTGGAEASDQAQGEAAADPEGPDEGASSVQWADRRFTGGTAEGEQEPDQEGAGGDDQAPVEEMPVLDTEFKFSDEGSDKGRSADRPAQKVPTAGTQSEQTFPRSIPEAIPLPSEKQLWRDQEQLTILGTDPSVYASKPYHLPKLRPATLSLPTQMRHLSLTSAASGLQTTCASDFLEDEMSVVSKRPTLQMSAENLGNQIFNVSAVERQKKIVQLAKEAREERSGRITGAHQYLLDSVAFRLDLSLEEVEEFIKDYDANVDLMDEFLKANGSGALLFYYQVVQRLPKIEECGRLVKGTRVHQSDSIASSNLVVAPDRYGTHLFVSDGAEQLTGECVFFLKNNKSKELVLSNIADEVTSGYFDCEGSAENMIPALQDHIQSVIIPRLEQETEWGKVKLPKKKAKIQQSILEPLQRFQDFLDSAAMSVNTMITLERTEPIDLSKVTSLKQVREIAADNHKVRMIETQVNKWLKDLEFVVKMSNQVRNERDDLGPNCELDFWRQMSSRFQSIINQFKTQHFKMCIQVLHVAKSRVFEKWKKMDLLVTEKWCEAKDNTKYLYSLEKYFAPLYKGTPSDIMPVIPSLWRAIRIVHGVSKFYNTSERMAALLIKIASQLIVACQRYISAPAGKGIWSQDPTELDKKINECKEVLDSYKAYYYEVQRLPAAPGEQNLDFAESYIFGKITNFRARLDLLTCIIQKMTTLAALEKSNICGISNLIKTYNECLMALKTKQYSFLDFKDDYIKQECLTILEIMKGVERDLQAFMERLFDNVTDVNLLVFYLRKFIALKLPFLDAELKFKKLVVAVGKLIDRTSDVYKESYLDPPIQRNMPLHSGRIAWARLLYSKVEIPMMFIKDSMPSALVGERVILKAYNGLCKTLIKYEMWCHSEWVKSLHDSKNLLKAPVLVRCMPRKRVSSDFTATGGESIDSTSSVETPWDINFDPGVLDVIRDGDFMRKNGFEVPRIAGNLCYNHADLAHFRETLSDYTREFQALNEKIPTVLRTAMQGPLKNMQLVFQPGFMQITWNSINLKTYLETIRRELDKYRDIVLKIVDIFDNRAMAVLQSISDTVAVGLPDPGVTWTEGEFAAAQKQACIRVSAQLEEKLLILRASVLDMLEMLVKHASAQYLMSYKKGLSQTSVAKSRSLIAVLHDPLADLIEFFYLHLVEAVCKCIKNSLEFVRKRIFRSSDGYYGGSKGESGAVCGVIRVDVQLKIPQITISPTLTTIQRVIRTVIAHFLNIGKRLRPWSDRIEDQKPNVEYSWDVQPPAELFVVLNSSESVAEAKKDVQNRSRQIAVAVFDRHFEESRSKEEPDERTPGPPPKQTGSALSTGTKRKASSVSFDVSVTGAGLTDPNTFRGMIARNSEIMRAASMMQQTILAYMSEFVNGKLMQYRNQFKFLWEKDRAEEVKKFVQSKPSVADCNAVIQVYDDVLQEINDLPTEEILGPFVLKTEEMKMALSVEARAWQLEYAKHLRDIYKPQLEEYTDFISKQLILLEKPIKELSDVEKAMSALQTIREKSIDIELAIGPIDEAYAIMHRLDANIPRAEFDMAESLQFKYSQLAPLSKQVAETLGDLQESLQTDLEQMLEKVDDDFEKFISDYAAEGPLQEGISPNEASDRILVFRSRLDDLWRRHQTCKAGQELFGRFPREYPALDAVRQELTLLQKLFTMYNTFLENEENYYDTLWSDFDVARVADEVASFQKKLMRLPKQVRDWGPFLEFMKLINKWHELCPLLLSMSDKSMMERHWEQLEEMMQYEFKRSPTLATVSEIMEAPLMEFKEDIEDICLASVREQEIEKKLRGVVTEWQNVKLTFQDFRNRGELLLNSADMVEHVSMIEDSLMTLNSLLNNRYSSHFKAKIQQWINNLTITGDILEHWLQVQNIWTYLEAVFVGGDIAKQLPKEAKRFANIDKSWQKIMTKAHDEPSIIQCCAADETLKQLLPHVHEQLELCQKSLSGYLEGKRFDFPRFYFISDAVLLEIIGQSLAEPRSVNKHMLSITENVANLTWEEADFVVACESKEGDYLPFDTKVHAEGMVESWLHSLLKMQQSSLSFILKIAVMEMMEKDFDIVPFLQAHPSQIAVLGLQIHWTQRAELAIRHSKTEKGILKRTNKKFNLILSKLIDHAKKNLDKFTRVKYESLITCHVNQRDAFDSIWQVVSSIDDFEWTKQIRLYFYVDREDGCCAKITNVQLAYQFEYIGCTERLVVTPLTHKCFISIAQALQMVLGCAPAGPAGTGKTESVKELAKALGTYCVVFNCSDQMDFRGLGKIYKGIAMSGCWGCFDEYNRIKLPVLSVTAQQIATLFSAKRERKPNCVFTDGDVVPLAPTHIGICITMNPTYAGRQELPENLKTQFRSVAMMVPDSKIIIRVKLASIGFQQNILFAEKFFTLYHLCKCQLSQQVHYDFGLRNILCVLRALGENRRSHPADPERDVIVRVLRDMNLSKLIDEDEPIFLGLINDQFGEVEMSSARPVDLEKAIAMRIGDNGLVANPQWVQKVLQLYETQSVRWGICLLGPTGSGKSTCTRILHQSLTSLGNPHKNLIMNPKAMTAEQMFGRLESLTNDWTDGVFSALFRRTLKTKPGDSVWITLDGPIDTLWIENLNSVLDDNRSLTLANGDRIAMHSNCKLCFEVHSIENASPATVSRMGMVFFSSSVLSWSPLTECWLRKRSEEERHLLGLILERLIPDLIVFYEDELHPRMHVCQAILVNQLLVLLSSFIGVNQEIKATSSARVVGVNEKCLQRLLVMSVMWSYGALLDNEDRLKLQEFLMAHSCNLSFPKLAANDTAFEYQVDPDGNWTHWGYLVSDPPLAPGCSSHGVDTWVPNVDSVRTNYLMEMLSNNGQAVLLMGEQGSAKTSMINAFLRSLSPVSSMFKTVNFSSATTAGIVQHAIESYVEKRTGSSFGPPSGRRLTVFIDDISMPFVNEWGDQITNELTRQLLEVKGFYSLRKPGEFMNIVDVNFVAAMTQPGGGRNDISERLKRHFVILNCTMPSPKSIDNIYGVISSSYFNVQQGFSVDVQRLAARLVPLTRVLWQQTKEKILPTPVKFHYNFNLRDLSRIWQGIMSILPQYCLDSQTLLALWSHECSRVLSDKLVSKEDSDLFTSILDGLVKAQLPTMIEERIEDPQFVNFLIDSDNYSFIGNEREDFEIPKCYQLSPDVTTIENRFIYYMQAHNESSRSAKLNLVFFRDCLDHIVRIARIMMFPNTHGLLVGPGGFGKRAFARLASYIHQHSVFTLKVTRSYHLSNFFDDIRQVYRAAGLHKNGVTLIISDNDIVQDTFLEYLNNLLKTGEISGLFENEEVDEISQLMELQLPKGHLRGATSFQDLFTLFLSRAKNNLHIILCFSPTSPDFASNALKFPGLFSSPQIDWYHLWPTDALVNVASHLLSNFWQTKKIVEVARVQDDVASCLGHLHNEVHVMCDDYFDRFRRPVHITPKSFVTLIREYEKFYAEKHESITDKQSRIRLGLKKLGEAAEDVAKLQRELQKMNKVLKVVEQEADDVLQAVVLRTQEAESEKANVLAAKEESQALYEEIGKNKDIAEHELIAAEPILEQAMAALATIKQADIATLKRLLKPHSLIQRVVDCVLILFKKPLERYAPDPDGRRTPKPSWNESLKFITQLSFLRYLKDFPRDTINDEVCELMQPYFDAEDYKEEVMKKYSQSVAGLLAWTRNMAEYHAVNKMILPLKSNLALQQHEFELASKRLILAEETLKKKEKDLKEAQKLHEMATKKKLDAETQVKTCHERIDNANELISRLGDERVRWEKQEEEFSGEITNLVGDMVIVASYMAYAGPFNHEFRLHFEQKVLGELERCLIPYSKGFSIVGSLTDPAILALWNVQGLPTDTRSVQNGIISTRGLRYPLMIDPQGQGKTWVRQREENVMITSINHKYFREHLEDALSLGHTLLIEDIGESLEAFMDDVLDKNYVKIGRRLKVDIGYKEADVEPGFSVILSTNLLNPSFEPELCGRLCIVDFAVTMEGLEEQLLNLVTVHERKELEDQRISVIADIATNKNTIKKLERDLLEKLTQTEGSLVDDLSLIRVLSTTKQTVKKVTEDLTAASEMEHNIAITRNELMPVAMRGSVLYFLIVEVGQINCMYQTSIDQFLHMFHMSMENAEKSPVLSRRIQFIIEYLTSCVHRFVSMGLYEQHKFLFNLLLAIKIDMSNGAVSNTEFQVFLKGGASIDPTSVPEKPYAWLSEESWLNIMKLETLKPFDEILVSLANSGRAWRHWYDSKAPEQMPIPDKFNLLSGFRRLMLIRLICPERTLPQATTYISKLLGKEFVEPVILNFGTLYKEATPNKPLFCLLSQGSDPSRIIADLAHDEEIDCVSVSMGQGQDVHARRELNQALGKGTWLVLQNMHLALPFAEEVLETINTRQEEIKPKFRLWVTSEESPDFPITFLQSSIKYTNDPPDGIKAGLKRKYMSLAPHQLENCLVSNWKTMFFLVSFIHTVIQERRKFGSLGWNIPYEFNNSDWEASSIYCQIFLDDKDKKKPISWTTLRFMLSKIHLGGRVTDDFDQILLDTFCRRWFCDEIMTAGQTISPGYVIPTAKTIPQILEHIESFPDFDGPQVFGLHACASVAHQAAKTKAILTEIINIQPKEIGVEQESRTTVVGRIAREMLASLAKGFSMKDVKAKLAPPDGDRPLSVCLRQEIICLQTIIETVRTNLQDLSLAIDGTIVMSHYLESIMDSLYDARIPHTWERISWRSSTLGFWFNGIQERYQQLRDWLHKGRPHLYWIGGFFNARGFLAAVRLEARANNPNWNVDKIVMDNQVMTWGKQDGRSFETSKSAENGVYVYGLHLEGAGWNKTNACLQEAQPKAVHTVMPVIRMFATDVKRSGEDYYECPVYAEPKRQDYNYICSIYLDTPSKTPPDHWTLRGVAALCHTR